MRLRRDPEAINKLRATNYLIEKFPVQVQADFVVELAMGKGEMITTLAWQNPRIKYIGIEKEATIALKAARLAQNLNLNNFQIICEDIKNAPSLLQGKLSTIYLTFPDPWPKNRHILRRLTSPDFLAIYQQLLTADGVLKFKTDNDKLWNYTLDTLQQQRWEIVYKTNDLHNDVKNQQNVWTDYETKWSNKGKNIHYLEVKSPK